MERILEDNVIGWRPSCNQVIYAAEVNAYARQVAEGVLPELPNGFSLVFDLVERKDPYNSGAVPPQQYTRYVAMRQLPVARPHTSNYEHDVTHIPGYQRMLGHAPYADLAQLAAFNSLGDPELCRIFTNAHDHFADQMLFLYRSDGAHKLANFSKARQYLDTLVRLAYISSGYDDEAEGLHRQATFDQLATHFELAEYEQWYSTWYGGPPIPAAA